LYWWLRQRKTEKATLEAIQRKPESPSEFLTIQKCEFSVFLTCNPLLIFKGQIGGESGANFRGDRIKKDYGIQQLLKFFLKYQ
jgi:hypothetical protein